MNIDILKKYLEDGFSLNKIAKETGKSLSTIIYWTKKYKLSANFLSFREFGKKTYDKYRYCPKCEKDCLTSNFYTRRGIPNSSSYCKDCNNKYNINRMKQKRNLLPKKDRVHTEESKNKISIGRKKFLKANPNEHPWKKSSKFKSVPCENIKKVLDKMGIKYVSEFTVSNDRMFSIDIAFPTRKIAIEVNGNQHYNKNGTLKDYYQKRHDYITSLGYKVYEIHYSLFFNENNIIDIINNIVKEKELFTFDYDHYLLKKLTKDVKRCECGTEIGKSSNKCTKCEGLQRRKVINRVDMDTLLLDIENLGYRGTGKKYGVSDNAIRKWIKKDS